MPRLHLVRHGRAAAGWNVDPDPALDDLGQRQALEVADKLAVVGPLPVLSSPLRRCRETSGPLAARWGVDVAIEPRVAEIPSPTGHTLETRIGWLRAVMAGTWSQVIASDGPRYANYRTELLAALASLPNDAVVFSHFIAINVVIGAATGDDRMVIASLDNCSVTTVTTVTSNGRVEFSIDAVGNEADTLIR
jgi:broad specificity phosphatase PhoE